jgi:hypothetical protein
MEKKNNDELPFLLHAWCSSAADRMHKHGNMGQ